MPKSTFFHLPKEKQKNLMKAAIKEFSNTSYADASINQIIKEAKISRGSFYMYFEDKEDLYLYMIGKIHSTVKKKFIFYLEENKGDIFDTFLHFFDYFIDYMDHHTPALFQQIWLNMNYKRAHEWTKKPESSNRKIPFSIPISKINLEYLNVEQEEDIMFLLEMLVVVMIRELVKFTMSKSTLEMAKEQYYKHITLLKEGFQKN